MRVIWDEYIVRSGTLPGCSIAITPIKTLNAFTHIAMCEMYLLFFFLSLSPPSGSLRILGRSFSISVYLSQIFCAQSCGVGGTEGLMTTGWLDAEIVVVGEEIGAVAVGGGSNCC